MPALRPVLSAAAVIVAVLAASAAPASAAPPACVTPPVKQLRTDTLATFVPDCGLGSGPAAWSAVYTITGPPAHGSTRVATGLGGSTLRYLPNAGRTGGDAFSYTVTTADGTSAPVTQQIAVADDVNALPVCGQTWPANPRIRRGASRTVYVGCSDADGDPFTYELVTAPAHATASIGADGVHGRAVTITPGGAYTGADGFTYRARETRGASAPATVPFQIIGAQENSAPSCSLDPWPPPVTTGRRSWVPTVSCQDPEGDPVAVDVVGPPAHGTAESVALAAADSPWNSARSVPYTSNPGYIGADSFTVRARDDRGATSPTFTVGVTVAAASGPPAPFCWPAPTVTLRPGAPRRIPPSCSGSPPAGLEVTTPPAHGTIAQRGGLIYTPKQGYMGPDGFNYRVLSAGGAGPVVHQALSIVPGANTPPSCWVSVPGRGSLPPSPSAEPVVRAGSSAPVEVSCGDDDGDPVSVQVQDPAHGGVSALSPLAPPAPGGFRGAGTYTPVAGFVGFDAVRVRGTDGQGGEATAFTDLIVRSTSFNSPPSCTAFDAFPAVVIAGTEAEYRAFCSDPEGDDVTLELLTPPAKLSLTPTRPQGRVAAEGVLAAPANVIGDDTLEWRGVDARGAVSGVARSPVRVIEDPGPVDEDADRGGSVGALQSELPTPARPVNVRLTTLNEGRVRITHRNGTAPEGWAALGLTFDITAPDAIPEAPIELRFRLDASLRAAGEPISAITVFRDGRPVGECAGDGARPDPCVAQRRELAGGDAEILILTSRASTWSFGRAVAPQPSPPAGAGSGQPPSVPPAPPSGPGTGGQVQGGGVIAEPVLRPPVLRVLGPLRLRLALASGLRVGVRSAFGGTARARLTLDVGAAKRLRLSKRGAVVVAAGSARAVAGREATIRLRFTPAARKALPRAARVQLTLQVAVGDGPAATRPVALRR